MQLPLDVVPVHRLQRGIQGAGDRFEPLEQLVDHRQHRLAEVGDDVAFEQGPVPAGRRTDAQLHLLHPAAQVGEQRLHVGHDDLEAGGDAMDLLPFLEELAELVLEPSRMGGRREQVHVEPRIVERGLAQHHDPGVDDVAHDGAAGIDQPVVHRDPELAQHLGDLDDAERVVDLEHHGEAGQAHRRGPDLRALAVAAADEALALARQGACQFRRHADRSKASCPAGRGPRRPRHVGSSRHPAEAGGAARSTCQKCQPMLKSSAWLRKSYSPFADWPEEFTGLPVTVLVGP